MTRNELITLRMNLLGGMHEYMRNVNDENCYWTWVVTGVPDDPDEEDLRYIAEEEEEFNEVVALFARLCHIYANSEADMYMR